MNSILAIIFASLGSGLMASFITVWFTRKNLRTTKYIDTITIERIKWIQIVREDFNELISSILIHIKNSNYLNNLRDEKISQDLTQDLVGGYHEPTDELLQERSRLNQNIENIEMAFLKTLTRSEITSKALLIKLKLNPRDDYEIICELEKIANFFSDYSMEMKEFDIDLNSVVLKIQYLLKREWDKVKDEVKKR